MDYKERAKQLTELIEKYTYEFIKDLNGLTRFLFVYCE